MSLVQVKVLVLSPFSMSKTYFQYSPSPMGLLNLTELLKAAADVQDLLNAILPPLECLHHHHYPRQYPCNIELKNVKLQKEPFALIYNESSHTAAGAEKGDSTFVILCTLRDICVKCD